MWSTSEVACPAGRREKASSMLCQSTQKIVLIQVSEKKEKSLKRLSPQRVKKCPAESERKKKKTKKDRRRIQEDMIFESSKLDAKKVCCCSLLSPFPL